MVTKQAQVVTEKTAHGKGAQSRIGEITTDIEMVCQFLLGGMNDEGGKAGSFFGRILGF